MLVATAFVLTSCKQDKPVSDSSAAQGRGVPASSHSAGSIYQTDAVFFDQYGHTVRWQSLQGKVRIMAMIFTHCKAGCPDITKEIKQASQLLPPEDSMKVQCTLISFDSKLDTPEQLSQYASDMGLGHNWLLLHGAEQDIRTVSALLDVKYKPMADGQFSHQNVILVVNQAGVIVLRRESLGGNTKEISDSVMSSLGSR